MCTELVKVWPPNEAEVYQVNGEYREAGAIGAMETFTRYFVADSVSEAMNMAREEQYALNREHIHIKEVYLTLD